MNWTKFVPLDLPQLIGIGITVAEKLKGAKGPDKEAAVIDAVRHTPEVAKMIAGRDVINDAAFDDLLKAYITARISLQNFLAKPPVPEGVVLPPVE